MKVTFIRKLFSRCLPLTFLLVIAFFASLPGFASTRPDVYWIQLLFSAWTRPLELGLLISLIIVPITYVIYRRWRPNRVSQEFSEKESSAILIIDFIQISLGILLIPYVCLVTLAVTIFSYRELVQLDSLQLNNVEYHAVLAPNWDENADYIVYECDLHDEECKTHFVYGAIGQPEDFTDLTQNQAKLGVADNKLFLCIHDHGDLVIVRDVLATGSTPDYPAENDPLCKDLWPTIALSHVKTFASPQ